MDDEAGAIDRTLKGLKGRGFQAHFAKDRTDARNLILGLIPQNATVCIGGSLTVGQIGIVKALRERDTRVINPFDPNQRIENEDTFFEFLFRPSLEASLGHVFLTGTNAVTEDGKLLNIDAAGNRVAGMFWGHPLSILIVGKNKIVKDLDKAFWRVKNVVAPEHIRRGGDNTPCAVTGRCHDCLGPERVCAVTTIIEHKPLLTDIHVVIVNEDLGLGWDRDWPEQRIKDIAGRQDKSGRAPSKMVTGVDIKRCWERFLKTRTQADGDMR
jgi:hypothetical protein